MTHQDCATLGHDWAPIALWDGPALCVPCRRNGCTAERRGLGDTWHDSPTGFGTTIKGIALDIEDDPLGGVAKIVCREIDRSYGFADIPFGPGDIVLDIGAHVGIVSVYLGKRYPDIFILAYEPVPANFARLIRNVNANGVKNVLMFPLAVTGNGRDVALGGDVHQNSGGLSAYSAAATNGSAYIAKSTTLAAIFRQHEIERCKLLKLDCEGAEHEILAASEHLLDRVQYLRGEFHINKRLADMGYTMQATVDLCKRHGVKGRITPCRMAE